MAELIDKGAFIEDIKTEIVNLAMDGLKGTPRGRSYLYEMIGRINEQPTITEAEIKARAYEEVFELLKSKRDKKTMKANLDDLEIRKYKEQLKEE